VKYADWSELVNGQTPARVCGSRMVRFEGGEQGHESKFTAQERAERNRTAHRRIRRARNENLKRLGILDYLRGGKR
jgi:hypothetical protein